MRNRLTTRLSGPAICLILLMGAFLATGWARLNSLYMYNPDSPYYVIMSRALVDLKGYRAIDQVDEPIYTWRPPGLPVLLMPAAALRPYDAVAAKITVLLWGAALLGAVFWLVKTGSGSAWGAWVAAAFVAASPHTLLYSSEVLSEVPFAVLSILVLALMTHDEERKPAWWRVFLVAILLAFLPLVRMIGITLIASAAFWSISRFRRLRWGVAVSIAIAVTIAWQLRNQAGGSESYISTILADMMATGPLGTFARILNGLLYYYGELLNLFLPAMLPNSPQHWNVLVEGTTLATGPRILYMAFGAFLAVLSLFGMLTNRPRGHFVALYFAAYIGALTVWPYRDERFLWPLLPFIWAFVPAGIVHIGSALEKQFRINTGWMTKLSALPLLFLFCWHAKLDAEIVRTNQAYLTSGEEFYTQHEPPFYFCDWQAAGDWLRENTPPHSRVLTRHAEVACTARRYQFPTSYERLLPAQFHSLILEQRATHLVVPSRSFSTVFQWRFLEDDPLYRYEEVYQARNVSVLAIHPNRQGTVRETDELSQIELAQIEKAAKKHPERSDLQLKWAQKLRRTERFSESIDVTRRVIDAGMINSTAYQSLAWSYLRTQRFEEAAWAFHRAIVLDGSRAAVNSQRGLNAALNGMKGNTASRAERTTSDLVASARAQMGYFRFFAAKELAEQARSREPNSRLVHELWGDLLVYFGKSEEAEKEYVAALTGQPSEQLASKVKMLRWERALASSSEKMSIDIGQESYLVDPLNPDAHLTLALLYRQMDLHGKALNVLEQQAERFSESTEYQLELADLSLFYANPLAAQRALRRVLAIEPQNEKALEAVREVEQLLSEPTF